MEVVVLDAGGDDGVPGNDVAEWHGVEECFGVLEKAVLPVGGEHGVPRDDVFYGHFVEQFARGVGFPGA